jgi:hypothetical protein
VAVKKELLRSGPAELYTLTHWRKMNYRRFDTAESAVRFTIERLPVRNLTATIMEVNEERFDHKDIRKLYEALGMPIAPAAEEAPEAVPTPDHRPSGERKPGRASALPEGRSPRAHRS